MVSSTTTPRSTTAATAILPEAAVAVMVVVAGLVKWGCIRCRCGGAMLPLPPPILFPLPLL